MSITPRQRPSFSFHIDSDAPHAGNTVPASVLVQVLQNAQLAFELIGLHIEGRSIKSRARVSASTSRRFQLVCKLPEAGCYAVPVEVGGMTDLLQDEQAARALSVFQDLMRSISSRSASGITHALPDEHVRRRVLEAIKGMAPRSGANWKLGLRDADDLSFADIDRDTISFVQQTLVSVEQREASRVITGELTHIDFVKRVLTMIYPPTSKFLDCLYDESLEDMLYERRRDFIQVTGRVLLDERGEPHSIIDVSDIVELDLSPIDISDIEFAGRRLRTDSPLTIDIVMDESKQLLCARDDKLGLSAFASTRDALLTEIHEQLAMLWVEYALADDGELDGPASDLKQSLLARFSEIGDAA